MNLKVLIWILIFSAIFLFAIIAVIILKWKSIKNFFFSRAMRRYYFKVYIIYPNGQTEWQPLILNSNNQFDYKGSTYDMDEECVKYEKRIPTIYYYFNVPNPINFRKRDNKNVVVELDGSTYSQVMKAKLIRDLVQEQRQFLIIMILLIATIGLIIFMLAYQMGYLDNMFPQATAK